MKIYIMTRGRVGKQGTLANLPKSLQKHICLVTPQGEYHDHPWVHWVPSYVDNYSKKLQYIMDDGIADGMDKCLIMDDDLVFSKKDEQGRLVTIRDPELLVPMFEQIESLLDSYPLVGVHPRQMGNNAEQPLEENGRIICIQGIDRRVCRGIKVDQLPILADVVLNCTLLSRGYPNALLTTFFQDHGPCQAPGGCSIYRTPEMQRQAAEYIAGRWPGFAKVVERRPKVAKWMGDVRYDYTCQWKKLFKHGTALNAKSELTEVEKYMRGE